MTRIPVREACLRRVGVGEAHVAGVPGQRQFGRFVQRQRVFHHCDCPPVVTSVHGDERQFLHDAGACVVFVARVTNSWTDAGAGRGSTGE